MFRVAVGLTALAGFLWVSSGSAQAFADCSTPKFVAAATDGEQRAADQPAFVCKELKTATIARGSVSVALRVVSDATEDQKLRQAYADIAADAADEAIENWAQYSGWSGGEVTVVLLDGAVLQDKENVFAVTDLIDSG